MLGACSTRERPDGGDDGGDGDASPGTDAGPGTDGAAPDVADAGVGCPCTEGLHVDHIFVVSDRGELHHYDPVGNAFERVAALPCGATDRPFSMAVDAAGIAWIVFVDSTDILTLDVNEPTACVDPGYVPGGDGFGLFGMGFAGDRSLGGCPDLYFHSYSGSGPFREGPGIGRLGVLDRTTLGARLVGVTDFDGSELTGTGDGRLYGFAGQDRAVLVRFDPETAEALEVTPLPGLRKTNASAFAFFAGDLYFFTEAIPPECEPCIDASCAEAIDDCRADPGCADALACVFDRFRLDDDDCGGLLPADVRDCLVGCTAECLPPASRRVSQVTRYDLDGSDGGGLAVVNPAGPIRIVGAGVSTCVPVIPF